MNNITNSKWSNCDPKLNLRQFKQLISNLQRQDIRLHVFDRTLSQSIIHFMCTYPAIKNKINTNLDISMAL